jgi:hypothetical protein
MLCWWVSEAVIAVELLRIRRPSAARRSAIIASGSKVVVLPENVVLANKFLDRVDEPLHDASGDQSR